MKKTSYDKAGAETTKAEDIVKTVFEISLDRLVKSPTVTSISVTGKKTAATVEVKANS